MTKKINFSTIGFGVLFMTALAFSTQAVDAATYIYVTSSGQISSVSANIATHSGVILINSISDQALVGDTVTVVR